MFSFHFMVNAFRAGTIVAVVGGLMGWFMVLRRQAFAGHTLAVLGFPGAAGAVWLGFNAAWGYFGFCGVAALLIAALPRKGSGRSHESAGIGVVQAFGLAAGFLFVSLYHGYLNGVSSLLFGSFLGITDTQVLVVLLVSVGAVGALAVAGRPLLFASVDADVAAARGVPVRAVSAGFLLVLGLTVAEISQITGALLVFTVLVMPAAAAQALTSRPAAGLAASVLIALGITWGALTAAYHSSWPIGFWIATFGFAVYLAASAWRGWRSRR